MWQCGTIQLDFQLPQRFGAEYVGADGEKHRPIMIHRAVLGSIERFIAVLTEHLGGKFPVWMAPVQARILPISAERHMDYAQEIARQLRAAGLRVELDSRNEKIGYKVREAQLEKIPYMLIVGNEEAESGTVNVRRRDQERRETLSLEQFRDLVLAQVEEKNLELR